uniref:Phosphatidylinositol-glycan biosynthesis class X protein n=1 Tax=Arcella intermedia TaxID=1963864 RepID=A0A6B2LI44_9EUKA
MYTEINFWEEHKTKLLKGRPECILMLVETLPAGVYVDPFEMNELEKFGSGNRFHYFNDVDVEKPAYQSQQNVVLVYRMFNPQSHLLNISFPVHFRYQLPSDTVTHRRVYLNAPLIYVNCNGKNLVIPHVPEQMAHFDTWTTLSVIDKEQLDFSKPDPKEKLVRLVVPIPVGQRDKQTLVTVVTLLITTVAAFGIIYYIVKRETINFYEREKIE